MARKSDKSTDRDGIQDDTQGRIELARALRNSQTDWGDTFVIRLETLISDLSSDHLELTEAIGNGVDSVDGLAGHCEREFEVVENQVETLVRVGIAGYDDNGRLIIPHETIIAGPMSSTEVS